MKDYLVSAIVSTYKAERFARGLLEDLEAQTLGDRLEIVIVDSNSPQNEGAIVKEFQERYNNIVYLRTAERETSHAAFNRCMKMAHGKYLTLACTDDRHKSDALERMAAVLESRPDIALTYANSDITLTENETFDKNSKVRSYRWLDFDPLALLSGCYMGPQPMWRKSLHERYGYFDGTLESAGDWEFWLRLAENEQFLHIDETLGLYLFSKTSSEHNNPERHKRELAKVKAKYIHRESELLEREFRAKQGVPADNGILALIVKKEASCQATEHCVNHLCSIRDNLKDLSIRAVKYSTDVPENILDVNVCPSTLTAIDAMNQAARWESKYALLLSPNARPTEDCIQKLLAIAESNTEVAATGPLLVEDAFLNDEADNEWSAVDYLPSHCLLVKTSSIRDVGGINASLPLNIALLDLSRRLRSAGHKVACANRIRMPHDALSLQETTIHHCLSAAEAALKREDIEAAITNFNSVLEMDSASLHAQVGIAEALQKQGNLTQAMKTLKDVSLRYPANVDVLAGFAKLSLALGSIESAQKALTHIKSIAATHPTTLALDQTFNNIATKTSC